MRPPSLAVLRTQSDQRLVGLARQGHERAFEAIVERYRKPLHRECRRVLSEGRAEDAVQLAFLAAWAALQRGDDVRELRPWLHRIGHNSALNVARAPGFDYDELSETLRLTEAPQEAVERRVAMRQTLAGIAALPERQREALLRTALEDTSQDEIARDLGLSHGAVRQLVHRARISLRTAMTAVTPLPIVAWLATAGVRSDPMAQRIAELAAGGAGVGAAATAAKVGAAVVVAGGAITGPAALENQEPRVREAPRVERKVAKRPAPKRPAARAVATPAAPEPTRAAVAPAPVARPAPPPEAGVPVRLDTGGAREKPPPQPAAERRIDRPSDVREDRDRRAPPRPPSQRGRDDDDDDDAERPPPAPVAAPPAAPAEEPDDDTDEEERDKPRAPWEGRTPAHGPPGPPDENPSHDENQSREDGDDSDEDDDEQDERESSHHDD